MIGQRVHQYQIIEKIGEGGMGVVYKAEDTRLQRTVALKFLHPLLVTTLEDQQRLVSEARAAAGLSHPNICTIYEINETDSRVFIVMEYVEGMTLRDRILSGHIETEDAIRYLLEITDGLKRAHSRGIVHRDMKSSNIMITNTGRAVIMDFGLARPVGQGRGDDRFSSRGTTAYMSPEHARGDPTDRRTDIWSLGIVLYEMLTGHLPFRGDYEQAVTYAILNDAPRPLGEMRPSVPPEVARIVERCLRKNPDERYQSLDELSAALRAVLAPPRAQRPSRGRLVGIAGAAVLTLVAAFLTYDFIRARQAGGHQRVPIAVIDFNNETDEPALDGLSGMLITALEQSQRLSVMTRSRMFDLAKTIGAADTERIDESLGQRICEASGVDVLVIPTIRRFGDLYTIDLKVLDVRQHKYIHSDQDRGRGVDAIPNMIDDLARGIRVDLREASDAIAGTAAVADVTTPDLEAYQAYFDGEELLNRLEFSAAGKAFDRAIARDSTFALAYYRLAYTEWWSRGRADDARRHIGYAIDHLSRVPLKERFLVRALKAALDDGFEAQLPILTEMRALYPDDKEMLFGLGDAEFHSARYDSSVVHFRAALAIDPVMERALQHLTWALLRLERYADARAVAVRWVGSAQSSESYQNLALAELRLGDTKAALAALDTAEAKDKGDPKVWMRRANVYFAEGDTGASLRALDTAERLGREREPIVLVEVLGFRAGVIYPYLGRYRDGLVLFEKGEAAAVEAFDDSSLAVSTVAARGRLLYRAYHDLERTRAIFAALDQVSPRLRKAPYWDARLSFALLTGDTTTVRDLLAAHRDLHPEREHRLYRSVARAVAGDCDGSARERAGAGKDELRSIDSQDLLAVLIGHCRMEQGDARAAVAELEPVLERPLLNAGIAVLYANAWYDLGRAYEAIGRPADARRCYAHLIALWKDADADLPLRRDVMAAHERLRAAGTM